MTVVLDASVVVAALTDGSDIGAWARAQLAEGPTAAPEMMLAEAANVLRRAVLRGDISDDSATMAHFELIEMPIALFSYEPVAGRVWDLHQNLSIYDAWYVAIAEQLEAPLATLDRRLASSFGPLCQFRLPRATESLQTGME